MDPLKRYLIAHDAMEETIPPQVLRNYLDAMAIARRNTPGLHNKAITVTRNPVLGILDWDIMLETGTEIRVQGQRWL
jgi:hypothetical protein